MLGILLLLLLLFDLVLSNQQEALEVVVPFIGSASSARGAALGSGSLLFGTLLVNDFVDVLLVKARVHILEAGLLLAELLDVLESPFLGALGVGTGWYHGDRDHGPLLGRLLVHHVDELE